MRDGDRRLQPSASRRIGHENWGEKEGYAGSPKEVCRI